MPGNNTDTRSSGRGRAITHEDLAPRPRGVHLSSKTGALLTILCILSGLLCFILSLFAEATRSEVTWVLANNNGGNKGHHHQKGKGEYDCMYSGSGKVPLICASLAFVILAIAMLVHHSFMLIAISKTSPPVYISWDPESSRPIKSLTWQAGFFFLSTWDDNVPDLDHILEDQDRVHFRWPNPNPYPRGLKSVDPYPLLAVLTDPNPYPKRVQ